jgi:hypothetical protein
MSEPNFISIYALLHPKAVEGEKTTGSAEPVATAEGEELVVQAFNSSKIVCEIADRIGNNELYWRDDYGRVRLADNVAKELVRTAIRTHVSMIRAWEYLPDETDLSNPVFRYWHSWEAPDGPDREEHVLVRGGFLPGDAVKNDKTLGTTERNTLLRIIAALCDKLGINPNDHGAAVKIEKLTESIDAKVSDDTVRKVLRQVIDVLDLPPK